MERDEFQFKLDAHWYCHICAIVEKYGLREFRETAEKQRASNYQITQTYIKNFNKENKTFKCERHVSATPVPSSVYGWNYNDEQYIVEN